MNSRTVRIVLFLFFVGVLFTSCNNEDKVFTLKTIKLQAYLNRDLVEQNVYFKVVDQNDSTSILGTTDTYPSKITFPAVFGVKPFVNSKLYQNSYIIQLWGETTGLIGSCQVEMSQYKIIFPLEMEVENDEMTITIAGSWH
tara:strand:+ start:72 stop:494 length:423 start_codon:yes stop_codon:yes gene_type:complete